MAEKIELAVDYVQTHPDEAARVLEQQPPAGAAAFIERIENYLAAAVLGEMLPVPAARCVLAMNADAAAEAMGHMRAGAAAAILRCLSDDVRGALLNKMPKRKSLTCAVLLNYAPNMTGAWMNPLVLIVPGTATAGDVLERIRDDSYDDFYAVYVVDQAKKLLGVLTLDALISAEESRHVSTLARPIADSLPDRAALSAVADHPGWNDRDDLPVLDRTGQFVGILRHADLRQGLSESAGDAASPGSENTLMGLVEASIMGMADIVEATVATPRSGGVLSVRE